MAYKIEIIQTRKAVIGAGTSNKFEALDFAHRFIRNLDNIGAFTERRRSSIYCYCYDTNGDVKVFH